MTDYVITEERVKEIVEKTRGELNWNADIFFIMQEEVKIQPLSEKLKKDRGIFINERCNCKNSECIDFKTEMCSPWKCAHYLKNHDAQVSKKERERIFLILKIVCSWDEIGIGKIIYDSMRYRFPEGEP